MGFLDTSGLTYFYDKIKEKFIRSVSAGSDVLTPDINGNVTVTNVATSNNLTSPDAQTSFDNFIYRTSGGNASLTSGEAQLMYIDGNINIVGRITENFNITSTNNINIDYDAEIWRQTIDVSGTYYFRYASPTSFDATTSWSVSGSWTRDGVGAIILSTYGLSASNIVNPSITVTITHDEEGISAATVVPATFMSQINSNGIYNFIYSETAGSWQYENNDIFLTTYGIEITGTPVDGDTVTINYIVGTPNSIVTVVYTAAAQGTIYVATPETFSATGFNQFDKTTMVIDNATFNNGTIAVGANKIAYCRAKGKVDNGYVAYSENEYILGIGWTAELPDIGSIITTTSASVSNSLASIPFTNDGYVVVEVSSVDDLCIHPKWSGAADTEYQAYVAPSVIELPTEDVEGIDLPLKTYGMPRIGSIADRLDLDAGAYIQRIGRLVNTSENMATVIGYGTAYDYDNNYIYYVLPTPVSYIINISPDYIVNDWGTEEFTGTDVSVSAQILYSQNLRDKLRTDVLTISNQTPALTSTQLATVARNIGLALYPVGSIYMSTNSTNPTNIFGGTWEQIQDRFLLAAGSTYAADSTGGSATHLHTTAAHTLTEAQIPKITGSFSNRRWFTGAGILDVTGKFSTTYSGTESNPYTADNTRTSSPQKISLSFGGGGSHSHGNTGSTSNLPPYLAVYVWKRTA